MAKEPYKKPEAYSDILKEMLSKDLVLFAPKNSADLRTQYPELNEYPELKELNSLEMLYVWAFACQTSPFLELPESERIAAAAAWAWPGESTIATRTRDMQAGNVPGHIKVAIRRMKSFNATARIEERAFILKLRENCKQFIAQDVMTLEPEAQDKYWINVQRARKEMEGSTKTVENGSMGLAEVDETFVPKIKAGLIAQYHKKRR
jgi:hypothetical protein